MEAREIVAGRLKRENYDRTKHDRAFSEWKILIGPTDWEDHLQKKEGAEKYRTHNLPNSASCSGIYELGVALISAESGREFNKLRKKSIIPVYIGQSDNVRTRLQHYGRVGSHLGKGFSKGELDDDSTKIGLFGDIFARGFSIVYRWAPVENKNEAQRKESQLLHTFDYAWNKESNGARRPNDIHKKLELYTSNSTKFPFIFKKIGIFPQRQVGLKINTPKPISSETESTFYSPNQKKNTLSRIFKFGNSRPRLVTTRNDNMDPSSICGVALGRGSVCIRPPVDGRKRCADHKGMKINGPDSKLVKEVKVQVSDDDDEHDGEILCGVDLQDGSFCSKKPVLGRKRCEEHKGMRVNMKTPKSKVVNIDISVKTVVKNESLFTCAATTLEGSFCRRKPSNGGIYCWQHECTRQ